MGRLLVGVVAAAAAAVALAAAQSSPTRGGSARCVGRWQRLAQPAADLTAVAPLSATDVWALGTKTNAADQDVIGHWDGAKFSLLPAPRGEHPSGIAAVSRGNVWVVGAGNNGGATIEHWNGTRWQRRTPPSGIMSLTDVAMTSATSGWAVGESQGAGLPVILHWNGRAWKKRVLQTDLADNGLYAVATEQPNDAWAVGSAGGFDSTTDAFATHWNGRRWQIIHAPVRAYEYDAFDDVAVASQAEAWAIQSTDNKSFIQRWDGRRWRVARAFGRDPSVSGVVAFHREAWAVGGHAGHPFLLHWNGRTWSAIHSALDHVPGSLTAASALSRHMIWAVGSRVLARYSCV